MTYCVYRNSKKTLFFAKDLLKANRNTAVLCRSISSYLHRQNTLARLFHGKTSFFVFEIFRRTYSVYAVASPASGHVSTCPPWRLRKFFSLYVETTCLVWFGTMPNSNSALFVQPYSLWSDTITGYNGACAKVNVVFTARRYAL